MPMVVGPIIAAVAWAVAYIAPVGCVYISACAPPARAAR